MNKKKILSFDLTATAVLLWTAAALSAPAAPQLGTADEARAMLERAVVALKNKAEEIRKAEFDKALGRMVELSD